MLLSREEGVSHEAFMDLALEEADQAAREGEVPVGAVAVQGDRVIARGHNQRERQKDPTSHAEISVLREAARCLGRWRLTDVRVYVTLEPCAMCAGALILARISHVIFGCRDLKAGACGSVLSVVQEPKLNHDVHILSGIRAQECSERLSTFFEGLRGQRGKPLTPLLDVHAQSQCP